MLPLKHIYSNICTISHDLNTITQTVLKHLRNFMTAKMWCLLAQEGDSHFTKEETHRTVQCTHKETCAEIHHLLLP